MDPNTVMKLKMMMHAGSTDLEQTVDLASLRVDIDVEVAGSGRQTRDGLDVGSEGVPIRLISHRHFPAAPHRTGELTGIRHQRPCGHHGWGR